jgi:hypothetical protein
MKISMLLRATPMFIIDGLRTPTSPKGFTVSIKVKLCSVRMCSRN